MDRLKDVGGTAGMPYLVKAGHHQCGGHFYTGVVECRVRGCACPENDAARDPMEEQEHEDRGAIPNLCDGHLDDLVQLCHRHGLTDNVEGYKRRFQEAPLDPEDRRRAWGGPRPFESAEHRNRWFRIRISEHETDGVFFHRPHYEYWEPFWRQFGLNPLSDAVVDANSVEEWLYCELYELPLSERAAAAPKIIDPVKAMFDNDPERAKLYAEVGGPMQGWKFEHYVRQGTATL